MCLFYIWQQLTLCLHYSYLVGNGYCLIHLNPILCYCPQDPHDNDRLEQSPTSSVWTKFETYGCSSAYCCREGFQSSVNHCCSESCPEICCWLLTNCWVRLSLGWLMGGRMEDAIASSRVLNLLHPVSLNSYSYLLLCLYAPSAWNFHCHSACLSQVTEITISSLCW